MVVTNVSGMASLETKLDRQRLPNPVLAWRAGWGLLLLGLVFAGQVMGQTPIPAPSGLIAWWSGDGSANDLTGAHNGTLMGGATASEPGVVGNAFLFDGTNAYVEIPDAPDLHPAYFTIEAWVRCDALDTPTNNSSYPGQQYLIFHQNAEYYAFEGFDLAKDREPRGTLATTNDTWCFEQTSVDGDNVYVESVTRVQTNVWYHLAGVRGSNYIQLYVNGKLEAQTSINFPSGWGGEPLYFGTTGDYYWDHKFGGALDEVGFYNRPLSSNEIAAIYAAGRAGKCKAPTALGVNLTNSGGSAGQNTNPSGPQGTQIYPQVMIGGLPGQSFGIQTATSPFGSPADWIGLTNLMLSDTSTLWQDTTPAVEAQRFYRVVPGTISVP